MSEEVFQPAAHLIQMVDTHRSQWKWRCVRCKEEHLSAIQMMELPCLATTGLIDAAQDLMSALIGALMFLPHVSTMRTEATQKQARAAIAKARGES